MNGQAGSEPRLIFPGLARFYAAWREIAFALVRVCMGYIMFMHGWAKVTGPGLTGIAGFMAKIGLVPLLPLRQCSWKSSAAYA